MKKFVVFNKQIAMELVREGFDIVNIEKNTKDERFSVFKFEETPEFLAAIEKHIQNKK